MLIALIAGRETRLLAGPPGPPPPLSSGPGWVGVSRYCPSYQTSLRPKPET